jgi:nitroreductase
MNKNPNELTIKDAIINRRLVRCYLKKPLSKKVIKNIFELSRRAPSNCNIQPWNVYVSSGKSKDRLKRKMVNNVLNDIEPNSDYKYPDNFVFNMTYLKI